MPEETRDEEARDWFQDPPPRRVGALALITRGTQVLMVSRPYRAAVSEWGLPGGSAAANELPRRALSRLLAERLTLRATAGRMVIVDHVPEQPGQHREGTNYVYRVDIPDDVEPAVTKAGGLGEARWVERANVGDLAVDHALRRIEHCLLGVPLYSDDLAA
ncbi:NUDIX domain-containing protein [Streptomyces ferrugineus]|uniref:NUDIX domain-containing protein n=1 Tax=Streptomyces ferrugineus TaxID=1413221 RepID=A0A7M2SUZ4_9ACTN|nr:NUDIX domain-containing protein [Streptomyces ferrugineus]QOV40176.1 NUDIX domain-containing protein [Streptomyces ferrugineus]